MNLLLLLHDINAIGGMEVQLSYLAGGLAKAGHDVRLVSVRSEPSAARGSDVSRLDPRVEVSHLGAHGRAARAAAVVRLARLARDSDVVHCTGWDTSLWGRLAAVLARRRVVVADHAGSRVHQVSSSGAPRARWIALHNRLLDPFTGATIICADRQRDVLLQEGVDPEKIVLIPNGVPVGRLRLEAAGGLTRADLGIPPEAKVLAHVANFRPMKRQALALETTARLREALGDVRVLFAGAGPELEAIRALAAERSADWAVFLGAQRNIASVFTMADVAILPSSDEALPMALLEGMAVGVPVVATNVGDVREVIERTGAGVCVPPDDHDAFYAAVHRILADQAVHRHFAAAAEAAQDEVDAATMVGRYERVFDAVLDRGPSRLLSRVSPDLPTTPCCSGARVRRVGRAMRVTVLTPTYNRAPLLPRLFNSLQAQTFRGFEWLIIDDGSTDDTQRVVQRFADGADFPVRYIRQDNSGKHIALNTGVAHASGEFCAVCDSDDWYMPEALATLVAAWDDLPDPGAFAEVQALCAHPDGTTVGDRYPRDVFDSDLFAMRYEHGLQGDRVGAIRTDVLRQFPFPDEFRGITVTEGIVWNRIARQYKTRGINVVLQLVEYQPDGLSATATANALRLAGPRRLYFKELAAWGRRLPAKERLRANANWVRNARLAGVPLREEVRDAPSPLLLLAAVPLGWLLAQRDLRMSG